MTNMVLGIFSSRGSAENAISELEAKGYNPKDPSTVMRGTQHELVLSNQMGAKTVLGGTLRGIVAGIILGSIAGLIASFGIPGMNTFFIGDSLASSLGLSGVAAIITSGATTGALGGGIIGALVSVFGLSGDDVKHYEQRLNEGGFLIAVPVEGGKEQEIKEVMLDFDANNIRIINFPEVEVGEIRMPFAQPAAHFHQIRKNKGRTSFTGQPKDRKTLRKS